MKIPSSFPRFRRAGFSLAEVTIATGITAMALTTLLGLIPEGLNNIKQAGDIAAETRITSHILGTVSQNKWQDAAGEDILALLYDHQRYYFDDQGVVIESDEPGAELAYVAEVRTPARDVRLSSDSEDSSQAGATQDPYLRRVTVKVASVANQNFDFERALPTAYRTHTTLIARTGK